MYRVCALLIALCLGSGGVLHATDQTIQGKRLLVKDPKPGLDSTKRKIVAEGKEKASPDSIVGDPTLVGATATVFESGATSISEAFVLPPTVDPATGHSPWAATRSGFEYKDPKGANGPVKLAEIKKSSSGTFQIKLVVQAKNGNVTLTPPNPGTSGCLRLDIGSTRYHVLLPPAPDGTVTKNDARTFLVKDAQVEGLCPVPAPPVCGNGIVETGEACDGGPFCGASCFASIPACCFPPAQGSPGGVVLPGVCTDAPGFSLGGNIMQYCGGVYPLGVGLGGYICRADGSCSPDPIDPPLSVCCQHSGSCEDSLAADTRQLWGFHNLCQGPGTGITAPGATCGPLGVCVTSQ
jgi:hypothetical protein